MSYSGRCYACVTRGGCKRHRRREATPARVPPSPGSSSSAFWAQYGDDLMAMSRTKAAGEAVTLLWVDEQCGGLYPALYEFLRETQWDDGKPRKTGTFLVTVDQGSLKMVLHDRDGRRCAWMTAETMADLLRRADESLSSQSTEWRKDTR